MTKFLGLDFDTTKDTFIPRPETELLVKVCLDTVRHCAGSAYILDIGTGTGNIAVSLTKMDKTCKIVALDESEGALAVARENARRFGVSDRIEFIQSNLYSNLHGCHCEERRRRDEAISFDIIVSNPPYIPAWEIATLAGHVKKEPRIALDGGDNGLDFYKMIIDGAPQVLKKRGYLIMEMGYNQSHYIKKILRESGSFADVETFKDFSNIERVIKAQWINS
ncbi:peptide chain release factor N(5)-glutamine methyltransferase [Omnitrophica bacterium]|nr:peptide chain release factor N(5)-glutamine methyltransferase [Candidatus Omnitrophota bacterium]